MKTGETGHRPMTLRSPYGLPPCHRPPKGTDFSDNGKPGILIVAGREK